MRVRFIVREVFPQGGLTLAVFRLALALEEDGHDTEVIFARGEAPTELARLGRKVHDDAIGPGLWRRLEQGSPDVILVCDDSPEWLSRAAAVAPTLLHAQMHWGVCADAARYWNRTTRPCAVKAGRKCLMLRPALGCSSLTRTLEPRHVTKQIQMLRLLRDGPVGVVCVSTDQAELYMHQGVPRSRILVLPNLGIRMSATQLRHAAEETPAGWRSSVAYFGRLTKAKGAAVLPRLATVGDPRIPLRVFGEGYMADELQRRTPEALCGHISQSQVAGVLMWARAVVFPSLWPEPGGIVGIDAQIFGSPVAAFDVGAPRFWPNATRFGTGDVENMARWLADQQPRTSARDPRHVAALQAAYWARIGTYASSAFATFGQGKMFQATERIAAEVLMAPASLSH